MMTNYLIKATYYSEYDERDVICQGVVVAEDYAEAIKIFSEDLNCTIGHIEVYEIALSNRIVWLTDKEYERILHEDVYGEETEDEPF